MNFTDVFANEANVRYIYVCVCVHVYESVDGIWVVELNWIKCIAFSDLENKENQNGND